MLNPKLSGKKCSRLAIVLSRIPTRLGSKSAARGSGGLPVPTLATITFYIYADKTAPARRVPARSGAKRDPVTNPSRTPRARYMAAGSRANREAKARGRECVKKGTKFERWRFLLPASSCLARWPASLKSARKVQGSWFNIETLFCVLVSSVETPKQVLRHQVMRQENRC